MRSLVIWLVVSITAAFTPSIAWAHSETGAAAGFSHGFLHPLTGADHMLAMIAVGILAYQIGGRALWLVPISFLLFMVAGGALGITGANIPHVELGIALSVIILGAAIALGIAAPLIVTMSVVGIFAIFHGHAHGAEMPGSSNALGYALGFVSATALLHLGGIGIGMLIGRAGARHEPTLVRAAGGLMTVAGLGILSGAL
ncbi:urease accessory protein [Phyllobacterium phragmitis]|uniref:Urease accessory protein n=1 Tax=Phyllobacterium phragmitis TaxID=2670329 RepID=A0A2S9IWQ5_9HYPH|nr:HupE/UreJ family protein [Phyllobacterium phragmitis]PRD44955.1 urease accessory protein [Phyllobacterium phragmitis]